MKANELRIGNLVNRLGKLTKITSLTIGTEVFDYVSTTSSGVITGNQIEPIPLTDEWLVKFGFECKDNVNGGYLKPINFPHQKEFLYCSKRGVVALWSEPENREFIIMNNCDHVHQLQNLYFALTGVDLQLSST